MGILNIPRDSKYVVGEGLMGGYLVRLSGCPWHIALFIEEQDANQYAEYATAMLHKHKTTDSRQWQVDA